MPYATRRVSINLPALGVVLPQSRSSNKTPPSTTSPQPAGPSSSLSDSPPAKKVKRSHTLDSTSASPSPAISLPSRPRARKTPSISARNAPAAVVPLSTPPPSPKHDSSAHAKIDKQGINDDIVVAVLEQLETTGNRPHLIKELVAALITRLAVVETSQNPVAIISSRLTNYLKRPWTALAPCPLAKEQVTVHPRRVYFYLTTMPRQEIPEYAPNHRQQLPTRHIISPSISSGPDEEMESPARPNDRLSPSPELELDSTDILAANHISEIHFGPSSDFALAFEGPEDHHDHDLHPPSAHVAPQEPLEHDEREFSRTAGAMRLRHESDQAESRSRSPPNAHPSSSGNLDESRSIFPPLHESPGEMTAQESEDLVAFRDREAALSLFGQHHMTDFTASPVLRPSSQDVKDTPKKMTYLSPVIFEADPHATAFGDFSNWSELKSPEDMELAELDDLLANC